MYGLIYYKDEIPYIFSGNNISRCLENIINLTYNLFFTEREIRNMLKTNKKLLNIIRQIHDGKNGDDDENKEENYNIVYIDKLPLEYRDRVSSFLETKDKLCYEPIETILFLFPYLKPVKDLKSQIYSSLSIRELRSILKEKNVKKLTKYRNKSDIIEKLSTIE